MNDNGDNRFVCTTANASDDGILNNSDDDRVRRPTTRKVTERSESTAQKLACAVSGMKGWRPTMEDQHLFCSSLPIVIGGKRSTVSVEDDDGITNTTVWLSDHSVFAVFDGHGGGFTSHYLKDNFLAVFGARPELAQYVALARRGNESRSDGNGLKHLQLALTATFVVLDEQLRALHYNHILQHNTNGPIVEAPLPSPMDRSGSTAVVVLLTPSHIVCANAGDSRAFLRRKGSVVPLSFDHKPHHLVERRRITAAGGTVTKRRVDGDLAVSRAFGDFCLKDNASMPSHLQKVIAHPDCILIPRNILKDEFIVLACDGIFDVASNAMCADFVQSMLGEGVLDLGRICEEALDACLQHNSRDNMTLMLVGLPGLYVNKNNTAAGSSNVHCVERITLPSSNELGPTKPSLIAAA